MSAEEFEEQNEVINGELAAYMTRWEFAEAYHKSRVEAELINFLKWHDDKNNYKHYPSINKGLIKQYLKDSKNY